MLEGEIRGVKEECEKLLSQQRHLQSRLHALHEELGRIHSKVSSSMTRDGQPTRLSCSIPSKCAVQRPAGMCICMLSRLPGAWALYAGHWLGLAERVLGK